MRNILSIFLLSSICLCQVWSVQSRSVNLSTLNINATEGYPGKNRHKCQNTPNDDVGIGAYSPPESTILSKCTNLSEASGNITGIYTGPFNAKYHKCWNILNPHNLLLEIELKHLDISHDRWSCCCEVYVSITSNENGEELGKWCECDNEEIEKRISVYSSVTIHMYAAANKLSVNGRKNFVLHYHTDESIKGIKGVKEAREEAINWFRNNALSREWLSRIPRVVTALALGGGADFDGKDLKELLMVKQRELRISQALMRDIDSSEELRVYINSLLATCHNPRKFYGRDLVELLQAQIESENFTNPASYLALCNSHQKWSEKAYDNLLAVFKNISSMPLNNDYQAFAVMAVSCLLRRTGNHLIPKGEELIRYYEETIKNFKKMQNASGSFGNVHRTALIVQALIESGHEYDDDWDLYSAVKYLMNSMTAPPTDFLSTYFILPVLNGKSLADISSINCSYRDHGDFDDNDDDYFATKIQVHYSLFIGETKDEIHTVSLKVPKHSTAFDMMKRAAKINPNYKFKYEEVSGKLDIYEIAGIPNDAEHGKFWLFYRKETESGNDYRLSEETGPNDMTLVEGDHIAMWYKKYSP